MKYRVKFKCYWYNTGAADNHYYIRNEDFDTLAEAQDFQQRVNDQKDIYSNTTGNWIDRHDKWTDSEDFIEIENGFIDDYATIVKYYPEREESV